MSRTSYEIQIKQVSIHKSDSRTNINLQDFNSLSMEEIMTMVR